MVTINEVKKEIKKKLEFYTRQGKNWVALHKNTIKHILEILDKNE